jgi:hypothetical protein
MLGLHPEVSRSAQRPARLQLQCCCCCIGLIPDGPSHGALLLHTTSFTSTAGHVQCMSRQLSLQVYPESHYASLLRCGGAAQLQIHAVPAAHAHSIASSWKPGAMAIDSLCCSEYRKTCSTQHRHSRHSTGMNSQSCTSTGQRKETVHGM